MTAPSGYEVQSPWVSIRNKAWSRFSKAAAAFGLSPSARTGLQVELEAPKSGKDRFFNTG